MPDGDPRAANLSPLAQRVLEFLRSTQTGSVRTVQVEEALGLKGQERTPLRNAFNELGTAELVRFNTIGIRADEDGEFVYVELTSKWDPDGMPR